MRERWIPPMNRTVAGAFFVSICMALFLSGSAAAQSSSLYGAPSRRRPLLLENESWTYQVVEPPPKLKVHDIITVVVDLKAQVLSEGEMDRKKKANMDAALKSWVLLKGGDLVPDPQSAGTPEIAGEWNNKMRSEGSLETQEAMKTRIACYIVDERPNGNLVIEGHKTAIINNEVWNLSLSGEFQPEDILPNGTILSERVANLRIHKQEEGQTRDAYRRGWLMRFLDYVQPF